MGIKLQANGKYQVSVHKRHPKTNRPMSLKRTEIDSKAKADRVYRELVILLEKSIHQKIVPFWTSLMNEYFQEIAKTELSNSTVYNREKVLRRHTLPHWDGWTVDKISTEEIRKRLNEGLGDYSEAHRKFFIKSVRGVFRYAEEKGYVQRNPTPLIKFKISDKIKGVLNQDQVMTLLRRSQEVDWPWYPHYAVALFTGMRNGELYALTWDKVDLDKRQILVNSSWNSKNGWKSTKSGDDRILEIPKPLLPLLHELKLKCGGMSFVLPRNIKWDKGEQARDLRLFLKSIGLPEVRFHDLRASWATMLLANGVAPSKVMAMGGWKDMDTMLIYMRKAGIDIKDSTKVFDGLDVHGIRSAELIELRQM